MAKMKRKLTSPDANLDPDVPTEMELRLEEELRLAYEAEILDEGGSKYGVMDDEETLTVKERGVGGNWIGEEGGDLEKVIEQLTREQLVEIVKEAVQKDKELGESVRRRFGFVLFEPSSDRLAVLPVENQHQAKAQDQLPSYSRRYEQGRFRPTGHQPGNIEAVAMPGVGAFGTPVATRTRLTSHELMSDRRVVAHALEQYQDQLHRPSWSDDYQYKYLPSGFLQGQLSAQHTPGVSAYDPPVADARAFNPDFGETQTTLMARWGTAGHRLNSLPGCLSDLPMNQPGSLYSSNSRYENQQRQWPMQNGYLNPWPQNNQYRQPHTLYIDDRHYTWPIPR